MRVHGRSNVATQNNLINTHSDQEIRLLLTMMTTTIVAPLCSSKDSNISCITAPRRPQRAPTLLLKARQFGL